MTLQQYLENKADEARLTAALWDLQDDRSALVLVPMFKNHKTGKFNVFYELVKGVHVFDVFLTTQDGEDFIRKQKRDHKRQLELQWFRMPALMSALDKKFTSEIAFCNLSCFDREGKFYTLVNLWNNSGETND